MSRMMKLIPLSIGLLSLAGVLLAAGCGGGGKTRFRFMNLVPDLSNNLDVLVDSKTVSSNVAYATATGYQSVAAGSRQVAVELSGTATALITQSITFGSGTDTTAIAANVPSPPSTLVVFTDNNSAPSTNNFNLRVINMSPSLGPADVYVETAGTDIGSVTPTVSSLAFGSASSYLALAGGNWEITVTATGQKFPAFPSTGSLSFSAGQVRTFVILSSQSGVETYSMLSDVN